MLILIFKTKARQPGIEPHFGMALVFFPGIVMMIYLPRERRVQITFIAFYLGSTSELLLNFTALFVKSNTTHYFKAVLLRISTATKSKIGKDCTLLALCSF